MSRNGSADVAALFDKLLPYDSSNNADNEVDGSTDDTNDSLLAAMKGDTDAAAKGLIAAAAAGHSARSRQPMKGRKSLSFTLLKPIDEEGASELAKAGQSGSPDETEASTGASSSNIEDVLQKWLGLSLFENKDEQDEQQQQGPSDLHQKEEASDKASESNGWVVVNSSLDDMDEENDLHKDDKRFERASVSSHSSLTGSPASNGFKALRAWDGTPIESMQLDEDVMSMSLHPSTDEEFSGLRQGPMPFAPDTKANPDGPSPTLAPEFKEDPLAEDQRVQRAASVPTAVGVTVDHSRGASSSSSNAGLPRGRRQSLSVLGRGPSPVAGTPSMAGPSRVRSVPSSALMALDKSVSEKYMKLELELDFEVELTCRGVRTKNQNGASCGGQGDDEMDSQTSHENRQLGGVSLVGKEEVGRLLSSGLALGKGGGFLSLGI